MALVPLVVVQNDCFSFELCCPFYVGDRAITQIKAFNDFPIALGSSHESLFLPTFRFFNRCDRLNFRDPIFQCGADGRSSAQDINYNDQLKVLPVQRILSRGKTNFYVIQCAQ